MTQTFGKATTRKQVERKLLLTKLDVARRYPDIVLPAFQAKIFAMINDDWATTSSEIAYQIDSPVQSVSTTLKRMFDAGWFERVSVPQESGGNEWEYSVPANKGKEAVDKRS